MKYAGTEYIEQDSARTELPHLLSDFRMFYIFLAPVADKCGFYARIEKAGPEMGHS